MNDPIITAFEAAIGIVIFIGIAMCAMSSVAEHYYQRGRHDEKDAARRARWIKLP